MPCAQHPLTRWTAAALLGLVLDEATGGVGEFGLGCRCSAVVTCFAIADTWLCFGCFDCLIMMAPENVSYSTWDSVTLVQTRAVLPWATVKM